MKSVKAAKRKKLGVVAAELRRAPKRRASTQLTAKQRLSTGNSRPGDKTERRASGKASRGLQVKVRRSMAANNGDGRLLAAVKQFEAAVRYFHRETYDKAREILVRLAGTGPPEVADRARVYLRLCEQRRIT